MVQHEGRVRTAIGFVIAPAAGALALSVIMLIFFAVTAITSPYETLGWNILSIATAVFAFGFILGAFVSVIGGVPLFLLLRNRGRVKFRHSTSIGAILGALSFPVFLVTFGNMPMDERLATGLGLLVVCVPIGLFCGTVGGAVFWWIVYGRGRSPTDEIPTTDGGSTNGDRAPLNDMARKA